MTASCPSPDNTPTWARPLLERQIDVVGQLVEASLAMALAVKDQTLAATDGGAVEPAGLEGFTRAFAKASRATRLSVMLHEKLVKGLIFHDAGPVVGAGAVGEPEGIVLQRVLVSPNGSRELHAPPPRDGRERLDREGLEWEDLDQMLGRAVADGQIAPGRQEAVASGACISAPASMGMDAAARLSASTAGDAFESPFRPPRPT